MIINEIDTKEHSVNNKEVISMTSNQVVPMIKIEVNSKKLWWTSGSEEVITLNSN